MRPGTPAAGSLSLLSPLWLPPAMGGVIIVGLVALLIARSRTFADYDALDPKP